MDILAYFAPLKNKKRFLTIPLWVSNSVLLNVGTVIINSVRSKLNIRLSWKDLPGTNGLAYYKKIVNYDRKKFYNIGPRDPTVEHMKSAPF